MRRDRFFSLFLLVAAAVLSLVQAQGEPEEIEVPKNPEWLEEVDLSNVPNVPVRPVGSGECKNAKCDGTDNDRCFETCGNLPTVEDIYGCPKDHQWALTFDDGPSNYTTELLDLLDEHNIKATFCVMGYHVEKYPEIVKRAYESGHQIASHTYSHPHLMSLSNEEIVYEIKATEEAIKDAIGIKPKYVRPPFGEADARVKAILKAMGYKVLLWNVDPTDYDVYMKPDASKRIQGAFRMAAAGKDTGLNAHEDPGFISLQHDLYKQSIAQVPHIIKYLKEKGYSFMTAAECLEDEEPHELLSEAVAVQNIKQMNESSINNFEAAAATGNSSKGSPASSSSAVINRVASHHAASSAMRAQAYNVLGFFTLLFVSALFF